MLWEIQPDGRYWADGDGFGAESDYEIQLYSYLDVQGKFTAPFRIYSIGTTKFIGTDLENKMKQELARKKEAEKKAEQRGETAEETMKRLINKCLEQLIEMSKEHLTEKEKRPFFVVFDIPKSKYMAIIKIFRDPITKIKWRMSVGVMIEHTDKIIEHIGSARDKEDLLSYLNSQEARNDVFKSVKELNEIAPDKL